MVLRRAGSVAVFLGGALLWGAGGCDSPVTGTMDSGTPEAGLSCGAGAQECGGACTALARDPDNCGACAKKCGAGEVCSQGQCALSCGGGTAQCGSACVDTKSDGANCGACGAACAGGQVCSKGACATTCAQGLLQCGQSCVDAAKDRTNCGACGALCAAGEICSAGKCELSCQVGLAKCGATGGDAGVSDASSDVADGGLGPVYCTNLQTDTKNCGACGVACGPGGVCSAGTCATTCGGGLATCGSGNNAYCANTQSDNANCGTCGTTCTAGKVCSNGSCQTTCAGNLTTCGSGNGAYCANTQTDNANCGTCGTVCGAGKVCSAGTCQTTCAGNLATCGSGNNAYCANTQSDNANCGTCGNTCIGATSCINGACIPPPPVCGDGIVNGTDECDDANATKCDGCESCQRRRWVGLPANAYISVPSLAPAVQSGSMCVELWAKVDGTVGDAVLASSTSSGTSSAFILRCQQSGGNSYLQFALQSPTSLIQALTQANCSDGSWHHFAGCREVQGNTVTATAFMDGAPIATATGTLSAIGTAGPIIIGGVSYGMDGVGGIVDEVRFSSTVRYAGAFTPVRRFAVDGSTIALYHLDEASGTTAVDAVGTYPGALAGPFSRANDTGYLAPMCQ